jgi:hypothetical protein
MAKLEKSQSMAKLAENRPWSMLERKPGDFSASAGERYLPPSLNKNPHFP